MDQVWLDCLNDSLRFLASARDAGKPASQAEPFLAFLVARWAEVLPQKLYHGDDAAVWSMAAFAAQIAAVIEGLVPSDLRHEMEDFIKKDMISWMEDQLNTSLEQADVHFHAHCTDLDAPVASLNLALVTALESRPPPRDSAPPVVYIPSDVDGQAFKEQVARTLRSMHPRGVVRSAPAIPHQEALDVSALAALIAEDKKRGLSPCLILARVATPVSGQRDPLGNIRALCDAESMWLHVDGATFHHCETWDSPLPNVAATANSWFLGTSANSLAAKDLLLKGMTILTCKSTAPTACEEPTTDSVDDMPALVRATVGPTGTLTIVNSTPIAPQPPRLNRIVPLFSAWVARNTWDWDRVIYDSKEATALVQTVLDTIEPLPYIEQQAQKTMCRVLLRFAATNLVPPRTATLRIFLAIPDETRELLNVDLVTMSNELYIRYRPFASRLAISDHRARIEAALARVIVEAERLARVAHLQEELCTAVSAHREMTYIPLSTHQSAADEDLDLWIPIGGVRYTPPYIDSQADSIASEVVEDLDGLNAQLAAKVQVDGFECRSGVAQIGSLPAALAGGGRDCVEIGLSARYFDAFPKDIAGVMVEHLTREAVKLERDSEFVARIANVIKRGIEQAEKQLQDESEEEYTNQPSILRMLPIVGSVLSWWRPEVPRNRVPVARTFSIATGFTTIPLDPALASPSHRPSISLPARSYASLVRTPDGTPGESTEVRNESPPSDGGVQDKSYFDLRAAFGEPPSPTGASSPAKEELKDGDSALGETANIETPTKLLECNDRGVVTTNDGESTVAEAVEIARDDRGAAQASNSNPTASEAVTTETRPKVLLGENPTASEAVTTETRPKVLLGENHSALDPSGGGEPAVNDRAETDVRPEVPPKTPAQPSLELSSGVGNHIAPPNGDAGVPPPPISHPSSEDLAIGVRSIFQDYATSDLNNKKIRVLLQQRLGRVDLKSRIAEIRELVDRELTALR
ncbi:Pyridoxal-dependent decarboxylase domain-containing protein 1 [Geranomyces variabilis]|uniref:Pyridoxal-dependent decarboxylase domain-containing protein 1 n=1 Tax=Geranomyces variabilis TaxID=109894 RepID=A0AAD5XIR4_9FUNG|nr:Pyridoxal-dependent decarboxylase domain-containing protein 1 [Geranomyces variabilis]